MELNRIRISNYKSIMEVTLDIKKLDGSSTVVLVGKTGTAQFAGFNNLTRVEFSTSVTSIGTYGFAKCAYLTRILMPISIRGV